RFSRDWSSDMCSSDLSVLITLGALLADVPHTRPIPVTRSSESDQVRLALDAQESTYEGPTGIVGVLQHVAMDRDVPGVSLWAARSEERRGGKAGSVRA